MRRRAALAAAALVTHAALLLAAPAPAHAQLYAFPSSAADWPEFYPTAYRDTDPSPGFEADWNCGTNTYDNHKGTDFGFGSWGGMAAGRDILAAAAGTVIYTNDGCFDMCSTADCACGGGFGNYVEIEHADGKVTYYAHMAIWSVAVSVGDVVSCGTYLGLGGSSGYSTGPHLHFEVRPPGCASGSCSEDPFDGPCSAPPTYWVDQGPYDGLPGLTCDGGAPPPPPAPCTTIAGAPACGTSTAGANDAPGSTSVVSSYACVTWDYPGPEFAYSFTSAWTEPVTATLTGLGADLDLFVLDGAACDPTACLASSDNSMTADETITFMANAGSSYAIAVDGYLGATSGYTLSLSCTGGITPPPPGGAPDLSMEVTIDDVYGQVRDFVTDGASAGIFDLYSEQRTTHRLTVRNAATAGAAAEGLVVGVWIEEPWLHATHWEVAGGGGAGDEPGASWTVALGALPPGAEATILVTVVAGPESAGVDHPDVRGWVAHADGVYEKADFWTPPTLNAGQTWNGGDLRVWSETDVWVWDGPGDPPGSGPYATGTLYEPGSDGGLLGSCGCATIGARAAGGGGAGLLPAAAALATLLLLRAARRRAASPRHSTRTPSPQ
jgi:murein DD-endopeptidase MepM/ murein hydrolase activator NlpD